MLEKVIKIRLLKYLENSRLLAVNQFGFCCNRSTDDAVTGLVDFVIDMVTEG